jgi:hypothetical protein
MFMMAGLNGGCCDSSIVGFAHRFSQGVGIRQQKSPGNYDSLRLFQLTNAEEL